MKRKEEIEKQAGLYTDNASNYVEWGDGWEDYDDVEYIEKAFVAGAKWADEHPNLYNDEKYHTVKVSCLDELNRKAELYDVFLDKACEWLKSRISVDAPIETNENGEPLASSWLDVQMERMKLAEEFIDDFRQAMEGEDKKV